MSDAIIIGAGPAGGIAALLLARRGWRVTLVEQHRFPRDKVCGECLSALGLEVLDRLKLGATVRAMGVSLVKANLHDRRDRSVSVPLPRPMLGISRHQLDSFLLQQAIHAGATVRQPVRCEGVETQPDGVIVRLRDLVNNQVETLAVDHVVIADGKSALPGSAPAPTGDIGVKSHWTGVDGPRDAIELFACQGCYGGLAAIEGERWNAAFSVPSARLLEYRGDIPALFAELRSENPTLERRLKNATQTGKWLAAPLPRFSVRKDGIGPITRIGNAAAALEPIGGEGMGLAMRSAELAVDTLIAGSPPSMLRSQYTRLWRTRRIACRSAALLAGKSLFTQAAIRLMKNSPLIAKASLQLIGK